MRLYSASAMREIDRRAIQEMGVPSLALMENAAAAVVAVLREEFPSLPGGRAAVLCGKGNNGGDGFAVARLLREAGGAPEVFLFAGGEALAGDAALQLEKARSAGVPVVPVAGTEGMAAVRAALDGAGLAVDALLGTGTRGAVSGLLAEAIAALNAGCSTVVSLDVPSGLSGDRCAPHGPAVRAALTVTLGFAKPVLFTPEGEPFAGKVVVADIGLPPRASEGVAPLGEALGEVWARPLFPARGPLAHKGGCGRVLIVAGSAGKAGAALLAARGALRAGAGLVTVAAPAPLLPALAGGLPEAMALPLPATVEGTASMDGLTPVLALARECDAVGMGPGLGTFAETAALARELYAALPVPAVADADALNAFAGAEGQLSRHAAPRVLTPHPGEMGRLLGLPASEVLASRYESVPEKARAWGAALLLKGHRTLVSDGAGPWRLNLSGGPHMAAPGMGDVLTGVVAALLARGFSPLDAASLGAWWHGAAADAAFEKLGGYGILASEVADALPKIEGRLRGQNARA